jgi:hypothetical protein
MSSPYLTALATDNFDYVSNPLPNPPWTATGNGLQALDGYCEAGSNGFRENGGEYTGVSTPNDSFCSIIVKSYNQAQTPELYLGVRMNESEQFSGYQLGYIGSDIPFTLQNAATDEVLITLPSTTLVEGDVLTLAVVGYTLYVIYNGTIIGSVVDTDEAFSSGPTLLYMSPGALTDVQISSFSMGSASNTPPTPPPSGGVFLGSVVVVSDAPSGASNPFLGTVTVIDSAPSGVPNPYLGKVVSGSAPSGVPNPTLGNVVVIASKPAEAPDVFLGIVEESS